MNRVVITGMGVISPIGNSVSDFIRALKAGKPAAFKDFHFDLGKHSFSQQAFGVQDYVPPKYATILDPYIQYVLSATEQALADSGLDPKQVDLSRIGLAVSSSKGGVHTFERFYERFQRQKSALMGARVYANVLPNIGAQWIARHWKITGPAKPAVAACATGLYAIMEGVRMIEQDEVDWCIAGAGDASITGLMVSGYKQLGVLSPTQMRPFDKRRDGFTLGEGAGIVILENEKTAKSRKAKIHARVLGHAYGFEVSHPIAFKKESDGLSRCLKTVLERAGISPENIDYLNLHGTGTKDGDLYETIQMKKAFGKKAGLISTSSTKSMTGHMVGATAAVEVIACVAAMKESFVPPTASLEQADPECDLDYTPLKSKSKKVKIAGSLSLGFGGQLGAIVLGE